MAVKVLKKTKNTEVIEMKKLFLAVLCVMLTGAMAYATSITADVNVKVSISGANLSVAVLTSGTTTTTWDASIATVGTWSVMSTSVPVINDSGGLTETFSLSATNAVSPTTADVWTLNASTGTNLYAMRARFNGATAPANTDVVFTQATHALTSGPVKSSITQFAGTERGDGVNSGEQRGLYVRVGRPSSVLDTSEHVATLLITAVNP